MAESAEERANRLANRLGGDPDPQPGEPGAPETPPPGGQEPPPPAGQEPAQPDGQEPPEEPFDEERAMRTIRAQREREKELRAQITALEREKMSELERTKAELAEARTELEASRLTALRHEVATAKGLPADAIEFLHGASRDELEQSADKLMRLSGSATGNSTRTPDYGAGARPNGHATPTDSESFSAQLRRESGRAA